MTTHLQTILRSCAFFSAVVQLPTAICLAQSAAKDKVRVVLSSEDGSHQLTEVEPLTWRAFETTELALIEIHPDQPRQSIIGLGASLEHATCQNLHQLPESQRAIVIEKLVDPDRGIGMNLMRVCIGTSDFVGEPYYTYCDLPEGQTDPELKQFSIAKDRQYVLPTIQMAIEKNPDLLIFASPWSPPAWMKDSGLLGTGSLKPEFYASYARYLLKFIRAYEAEGVPIYAITIQNEPQHVDPNYPTTLWSAEQQRDFIRDFLGPLFAAEKLSTQIWCWDHNWNKLDFPRTVLSDPAAAAFVDGTAFHHYEGRVDAQTALHEQFPDQPIYFTEGSVFRTRGAIRLIDILRHWSRSYNGWVIMLDEHRRPNRGPHSASATCIELMDDGSVRYNFDYFMQGQFMKYIRRQSVCLASSNPDLRTLRNVAFVNPDGQYVLVMANSNRSEQAITVKFGDRMFQTTLPASTIATFLW